MNKYITFIDHELCYSSYIKNQTEQHYILTADSVLAKAADNSRSKRFMMTMIDDFSYWFLYFL